MDHILIKGGCKKGSIKKGNVKENENYAEHKSGLKDWEKKKQKEKRIILNILILIFPALPQMSHMQSKFANTCVHCSRHNNSEYTL